MKLLLDLVRKSCRDGNKKKRFLLCQAKFSWERFCVLCAIHEKREASTPDFKRMLKIFVGRGGKNAILSWEALPPEGQRKLFEGPFATKRTDVTVLRDEEGHWGDTLVLGEDSGHINPADGAVFLLKIMAGGSTSTTMFEELLRGDTIPAEFFSRFSRPRHAIAEGMEAFREMIQNGGSCSWAEAAPQLLASLTGGEMLLDRIPGLRPPHGLSTCEAIAQLASDVACGELIAWRRQVIDMSALKTGIDPREVPGFYPLRIRAKRDVAAAAAAASDSCDAESRDSAVSSPASSSGSIADVEAVAAAAAASYSCDAESRDGAVSSPASPDDCTAEAVAALPGPLRTGHAASGPRLGTSPTSCDDDDDDGLSLASSPREDGVPSPQFASVAALLPGPASYVPGLGTSPTSCDDDDDDDDGLSLASSPREDGVPSPQVASVAALLPGPASYVPGLGTSPTMPAHEAWPVLGLDSPKRSREHGSSSPVSYDSSSDYEDMSDDCSSKRSKSWDDDSD